MPLPIVYNLNRIAKLEANYNEFYEDCLQGQHATYLVIK